MIRLQRARPFGYIIENLDAPEDARTLLVQTDWDYPGTASTFGWPLTLGTFGTPRQNRCAHAGTDGTIACADCGAPAGAFIGAAADWLDSHDGATADDPGYFDTLED